MLTPIIIPQNDPLFNLCRPAALYIQKSPTDFSIGDLYYLVTVILTLSLIPVYSSVTVIVTVPGVTPFTIPFLLTVAIASLLDEYDKVLTLAPLGVVTSFNWLSFAGDPYRGFRQETGIYTEAIESIEAMKADLGNRMNKQFWY